MTRPAIVALILASLATGSYIDVARAQHPDPVARMSAPGNPGNGILSQDDVAKINGVGNRSSAKAKALAREESAKLVKAINLACELTDAELVGAGSTIENGKTLDLKVYEISCGNGMGYFLESRGSQQPIAVSCFAAAATHAADIAKGTKSDFYCQLPANRDVKVMAASLMTVSGTACAVSELRWFGLSESGQSEYSEVVCGGNKGYLLKTPRSGPTASASAMSCQEAAKYGMKCRLTDGGPVSAPVSQQALRDALKQNGVNCEPMQMRVVGRESESNRYVVELQCPQQPKGLIAFIPLQGNTNKFETLDCPAAAEQEIPCQLTK
jgi:hypothetical protein